MVKDSVVNLGQTIINGLIGTLQSIVDGLSSLGNFIVDGLSGILQLIVDGLTTLGNFIVEGLQGVLEFLFLPSDNLFTDVKDLFNSKFGFINQIIELGHELTSIEFQTDTPHFSVKLFGKELDFINFSYYDQYKNFIHNIIITIAYFFFSLWLLHEIPCLLHGYNSTQFYIRDSRR